MAKIDTKNNKRILAAALSASVLFAFGCSANTAAEAIESTRAEQSSVVISKAQLESSSSASLESGDESSVQPPSQNSEIFSERDFDTSYDKSAAATIELNGASAQTSSNSVEINGSLVTIKEEGTYIVSGKADDAGITVDINDNDKVHLILDNADIMSNTSAPIYIKQADKVFITLAEGSLNKLANGGSFEAIDENNIDAVIFSKEDITLNGEGNLEIISPAGHGIVSKDSLRITSGTYNISSASHSLAGNDEVSIANADLILTAGKDGIHADNEEDSTLGFVAIESGTFSIDAQGDGIESSSSIRINGGTFDITTGGGYKNAQVKSSQRWGDFPGEEMQGAPGYPHKSYNAGIAYQESSETAQFESSSMKGVKASQALIIDGGEFALNCADDAFHSNGSGTVRGGTFEIASGDDAFHADLTMSIEDGNIYITTSYEGVEGLTIYISGGNISLYATDDGLNAAGGMDASGMGGRDGMFGPQGGGSGGSIVISGGTLDITAYGDGIDSNGTLEITGGDITVKGPTQGDTATLDTDAGSYISGGTFVGTGASNGMAQTFSGSDQGLISVDAGNNSAGTKIELSDSKGNVILSHTPELDFALVILSSPEIVGGETYTLTVGFQSGQFTAN